MAIGDIQDYLKLIPAVDRAPQHAVWMTYDAEADTLYDNTRAPGAPARKGGRGLKLFCLIVDRSAVLAIPRLHHPWPPLRR